MKQLVTYILQAPSPNGGDSDSPGERGQLGKDQQVTIEMQKMQQLCLYQLVLGYKLREAEARGEGEQRVGR